MHEIITVSVKIVMIGLQIWKKAFESLKIPQNLLKSVALITALLGIVKQTQKTNRKLKTNWSTSFISPQDRLKLSCDRWKSLKFIKNYLDSFEIVKMWLKITTKSLKIDTKNYLKWLGVTPHPKVGANVSKKICFCGRIGKIWSGIVLQLSILYVTCNHSIIDRLRDENCIRTHKGRNRKKRKGRKTDQDESTP